MNAADLPPPARLLIAVLAPDGKQKAGMGFLMDESRVLTCAHVIHDSGCCAANPSGWVGTVVSLKVEGEKSPVQARVEFISPPRTGSISCDDVCILRLDKPVVGFNPKTHPLVDLRDFAEVRVRALGVPRNAQESGLPLEAVTRGGDLQGRVFLSTKGEEVRVEAGFSGSPVIEIDTGAVIGMIVSSLGNSSLSCMLPVALIASVINHRWPEFHFPVQLASEGEFAHISDLREFALEHLSDWIRTPSIPIQTAICRSYERLTEIHRGEAIFEERLVPAALLEKSLSDSRIYIQGPGGSGKTSYLMRLMLCAINAGHVPFYLDVKRAKDLPPDEEEAVSMLFRRCTQGGGSYEVFNEARKKKDYRIVLIVDGLNENLGSMQRVRGILDDISRNAAGLSIISADRLSGSASLPKNFTLATVLPLDLASVVDENVKGVLAEVSNAKFRRLLTIPFFLDMYMYLVSGVGQSTGAERPRGRIGILRSFFEKSLRSFEGEHHTGIGERAITLLAPLAFEAYGDPNVGLRMDKATLDSKLLGEDESLVQTMISAGLLIEEEGGHVAFRHQLFHDFLVAEYLSSANASLWRRDYFDIATLKAGSFEALELTSELLGDRADEFVTEVYDWNYSAAIDCVLNLESGVTGGESPVSPALRNAIFALLADKRFDSFSHTRKKSELRAIQFSKKFGIDYAALPSREALVDAVDRLRRTVDQRRSAFQFDEWFELFRAEVPPEPKDWPLLQDSPVIAWTVANSFRRHLENDTRGFTRYLCQLYRSLRSAQLNDGRAPATRWRIVHLLGSIHDPATIQLLLEAVKDESEDGWVRYGAVRSLAEAASRSGSADAARAMFAQLIAALPGLYGTTAFAEIRDVALLATPGWPDWWAREYGVILSAGIALLGAKLKAQSIDARIRRKLEQEEKAWRDQLNALTSRTVGE